MSAERDAGFAALQQGDVATAISTLETAKQRDPNDYQTLLYLGAAYGQAERHTEAVTSLTEAVHLQPSNAPARYNLGVAYERAGWTAEALTAMQQALQLQPNYPQAQEALRRLQPAQTPAPATPQPNFAASAPQPGYAPQPQTPGYTPPQAAPAYGANLNAAPPQAYQPAPYGQSAPPYGSQPQPPSPYGAPQQTPNPGYGQQPNAPYGSYAPQAYQAAPASQGSMMTAVLICIGLVLLCAIGAGYFTYVTGMRLTFTSLIFGYLFGWAVPKVAGRGQAQGIIAGAGAGIASVAAIGVAYALGVFVSPLSILFVFYAVNRGYKLASGD